MDFSRDPDIQIEKLKIWVLKRQFANSKDYWDGNWLDVICVYDNSSSKVKTSGSILHLPDVNRFMDECTRMNLELAGKAVLDSNEPEIHVEIKINERGTILGKVEITPNQMTEHHKYEFEIDQTYLKEIISGCKKVLETFPIVGNA